MEIPDLITLTGNNILLVTGKNTTRSETLSEKIKTKDCKVSRFIVESEPTTDLIDEGVNIARVEGCNVVIGLGGGSAVDTAKAIAAMVPNKGSLLDYLEVVGQGKSLGSEHILLVDDDETIVRIDKSILKKFGYKIE